MASDLELHNRQLQSSAFHNQKEYAVCVRHAYKRYGTKKNPFVVLDNLNMTVPKGSIYGLLGASGCGKTTLLGCILGRKKLNSGEISVLGQRSNGDKVLGSQIGYMPQELCLHGEFTIRETLKYFGWIADMSTEQVEARLEFLAKLLMLPDVDKMVMNLSGGQQRRVSLASALLHEPELLLLDEPTVGVDPLLRQIIWDYLVDITKGGQTTVIITTHYIDETRQAHLIGLMRGGYFLKEESPQQLLAQYGTETLEEVFLKLSVMQNLERSHPLGTAQKATGATAGIVNESAVLDDVDSGDHNEVSGQFGDNITRHNHKRPSVTFSSNDTEIAALPEVPPEEKHSSKLSGHFLVLKGNHVKTLVWANFLWMIRNWPVMSFLIMLPVVQIALFCAAIGHDPVNLPVAVVNYETNNNTDCDGLVTCNGTKLSCNYLGYLRKRALTLVYYESEDEATLSVMKGETYASIVLRHNYTTALQARVDDWRESSSWDIEAAEISVIRDLTSKDIANYLKVYLYQTFQSFFEDYLKSCNINIKALSLPFQWNTPIYGLAYPNFTDFVTPGMILTITFFLAVASTAGAMLIQRNEGSFERALIIGITPVELLAAHVICQFVVMVIQMALVMICTFALFKMTINGSLVLVIVLTTLTGFCGMCFGFVISCAVDSERMATYAAMGSFFPIVLLCGIIWPIEAMHYLLQLLSFFLPLTQATESMRSILQRGWDLSKEVVYMGFVSVIVWIIIFLVFSILFLKLKRG